MRPFAGSTANCMFDPPVSTPISRMTLIAASRIRWYSRSVSVCAGATVIESPVCTPMGSKFSIEQLKKFFAIVGNTAAAATQREGRTNDQRKTDFLGEVGGKLDVLRTCGGV